MWETRAGSGVERFLESVPTEWAYLFDVARKAGVTLTMASDYGRRLEGRGLVQRRGGGRAQNAGPVQVRKITVAMVD